MIEKMKTAAAVAVAVTALWLGGMAMRASAQTESSQTVALLNAILAELISIDAHIQAQ